MIAYQIGDLDCSVRQAFLVLKGEPFDRDRSQRSIRREQFQSRANRPGLMVRVAIMGCANLVSFFGAIGFHSL